MPVQDIDKINGQFNMHGWRCIKALSDLDEGYLSEDLAQYERDGVVIDFGFYRDGTETGNGEFAIYIIADDDWENYLANLRFFSLDLALQFLRLLPTLTFAPDELDALPEKKSR